MARSAFQKGAIVACSLAILCFCSHTAYAATLAECTTYVTKQSTTLNSNLAKAATCVTTVSCSSECEAAFEAALQDARDAGMAACPGVKNAVAAAKLMCLKDDDGKSCGGLAAVGEAAAPVASILSSVVQGGELDSSVDSSLNTLCKNTCFEKGIKLLAAASGDPSLQFLSFTKTFVCKKVSGNYCVKEFPKFMSFVTSSGASDEDPSNADIKSKVCGNTCARISLKYMADYTKMVTPNAPTNMYEAMIKGLSASCVKNKKGNYCMNTADVTDMVVGDCLGKTGADADCKAFLEKAHEKAGCCMGLVCEVSDTCKQIELLLGAADLKLPKKCSLNAFKTKINFKLSGITLEQATAKKSYIQDDVATSLGLAKDSVEIELKQASRREMRLLSSGVQVDATALTATREDGEAVEAVAGDIELATTEQELESEGYSVEMEGAVSVKAPISNKDADGEVVDDSYNENEELNAGNQVTVTAAVVLGIFSTLALVF